MATPDGAIVVVTELFEGGEVVEDDTELVTTVVVVVVVVVVVTGAVGVPVTAFEMGESPSPFTALIVTE